MNKLRVIQVEKKSGDETERYFSEMPLEGQTIQSENYVSIITHVYWAYTRYNSHILIPHILTATRVKDSTKEKPLSETTAYFYKEDKGKPKIVIGDI